MSGNGPHDSESGSDPLDRALRNVFGPNAGSDGFDAEGREARPSVGIFPAGHVLGDRYEIIRGPNEDRTLIGGMALVYLCLDRDEERPVALKTVKPEYLADPVIRERLLGEATVWVGLGRHAHVVRCHGVLDADPAVYLILERVARCPGCENSSLRSRMARGQPMAVDEALLYGLQIARGMLHATTTISGLIHRDLKPENLLVGTDRFEATAVNRLRVTDFGLAKTLESVDIHGDPSYLVRDLSSDLSRTQVTHGIVGTPHYMSPEQWGGGTVTEATDVYAFGCILLEMLTGRAPVSGLDRRALRNAHRDGRASGGCRDLPLPVRHFVSRCVAVNPAARFSAWEAVEQSLCCTLEQLTGVRPPLAEGSVVRSRESRVALGWSYLEIGRMCRREGQHEVAKGHFDAALKAGLKDHESPLAAQASTELGSALEDEGQLCRAASCYGDACHYMKEIGDRPGEVRSLVRLAGVIGAMGNFALVREHYQEALDLVRDLPHPEVELEGEILTGLGATSLSCGRPRHALAYGEKARVVTRGLAHRTIEARALIVIGRARLAFGEVQVALDQLELASSIFREWQDHLGVADCLTGLGQVRRVAGGTGGAIDSLERALKLVREIGDRRREAIILRALAATMLDRQDPDRAQDLAERALDVSQEIDDRHGRAEAIALLGEIHSARGEKRVSEHLLEQAVRLYHQCGDTHGADRALELRGSSMGASDVPVDFPVAGPAPAIESGSDGATSPSEADTHKPAGGGTRGRRRGSRRSSRVVRRLVITVLSLAMLATLSIPDGPPASRVDVAPDKSVAVVVSGADDPPVPRLHADEILIRFRDGTQVKGRLDDLTDDRLRLIVGGGHVDVDLSTLRSGTTSAVDALDLEDRGPAVSVRLVTGAVLRGRLGRCTESDLTVSFPAGCVVLRRDMIAVVTPN